MKRLLLIFTFGLMLPGMLTAQDTGSLESLRAVAERGDAAAQLEMGILYEYGFSLPDNRPPALAWYLLAAEQGNARAIERRDLLQARMTQVEVNEARRLAAEFGARRARSESVPAAAESPPSSPASGQ